MKHTSGPWKANDTGAIFGTDGNPIMTCGEYAVRYGEGTEESFANALLIAAAPDLLAACKTALEMLQTEINTAPLERDTQPEQEVAKILKSAIAKAKRTRKNI